MGMFDFLKSDKNQEPGEKTEKIAPHEKHNYSSCVEVAKILTNNDERAVADIALLVKDVNAFWDKYWTWCEELFLEVYEIDETFIPDIFAFWLVGHDTSIFCNPNKFGLYIDWKEDPREIGPGFEYPLKLLGYPLSFDDIHFTGDEYTFDALEWIGKQFWKKGYNLVTLDTGSDSYHLFIVPALEFPRLKRLGQRAGLQFFSFGVWR